jgi:hypothetical protein
MTDRAGGGAGAASSARTWRTRWAGYAACAWALAFAAVHLYWGLGGAAGLPPGRSLADNTALFVIDLVAIPLCLAAAALALALARPWGGRLPRWLLLGGAWGAAALFVVHALPTVVDAAILALGRRPRALTAEDRFSLFLYEPWFLLGGVLFGAAAWRHMRETRGGDARPR